MLKVEMNNLRAAYEAHEKEINEVIIRCASSGKYIMGKEVEFFSDALKAYTQSPYVIPCANGTDALLLAMMALPLQPGDEILIPSFNYIAAAEAACLLKLVPRFIDVDIHSFNSERQHFEAAITSRTRAIVVVHLFGQCCEMGGILQFARQNNLFVIEDTAQSLGSTCSLDNNRSAMAGTMGDIGTLSFFPTKNLGCMGDGGALLTSDKNLADRLRMLTQHGQRERYLHEIIGVNSRLDALQAAILKIKLDFLEDEISRRQLLAHRYDAALNGIGELQVPSSSSSVRHTYNQYTLIVKDGMRNALRKHLQNCNISSMVYYPLSIDKQPVFSEFVNNTDSLKNAHRLPNDVLSIPLYPYLSNQEQDYVIEMIFNFFK